MNKVLVTGATGFLGRYVVDDLLKRGMTVVATSSDPVKAANCSWFDSVVYKQLDLRNLDEGINYFDYFDRPDTLVHLAWEGLPNYKALFHFEDNLPSHYAFLKNLVVNGLTDMTVAGTCLEYGMQEGRLSEDMPTMPDNPYALAKDSLRRFLRELQKKQRFSLKWARLFYLYGKGQNPGSLLPLLDAALEKKDGVFNMSGGEQVRDYLPVETATSYLVRIALQDRVTGVINCCSGNPVKVKDVVREYLQRKGASIELNLGHYPYPDYEPMSFWGDNKKLQTIVNEQ